MTSIGKLFEHSRRIVIKVGSSLLIDPQNIVRSLWLSTLAEDIADLHTHGKQLVIVSSGAIALGRQTFARAARKLEPGEKQAAAACGQIRLMSEWACVFKFHDRLQLFPAQILLTLDHSENRSRYLNVRNTIETLLAQSNIIPIVNENDTVATEEIRVGDNDRLAARVAQMISADLLVLLSDVAGLYTEDPLTNDGGGNLVAEIDRIIPAIEAMAGGAGSTIGSGGMRTKIEAAKICLAAGCHMLIADGMKSHPLSSLLEGGECTWFKATANPQSARKHWISGTLRAKGSYVVDNGAVSALLNGRSLLPAGVGRVNGTFERGDAVAIETSEGRRVGKGLTEYSSADAVRIIGAQSGEIKNILGIKYRDTLIHRDDLVLENGVDGIDKD
jgi:glutamate 5-kinase